MDERISTLVTQVTAGLRADPELCLDVQAEVTRHLEDTVAQYEADGKGSEESVNEALQVFGSPLELADTIQQANARRMRLRARLRLAVNALLIPVALLVALLLCGWQMRRVSSIYNYFRLMVGLSSDIPVHVITPNPSLVAMYIGRLLQFPAKSLGTSHGFNNGIESAGYNNQTLPGYANKLRILWEQHRHDPDGYSYFAYYTNYLNPERGIKDKVFEDDMRLGEKIEPNNALYNYKLAHYYLSFGLVSRDEKAHKKGEQITDDLLDQRMMELGISEFKRGLAKPYLKSYHGAMLKKRLALLPAPRFSEDYIQRECSIYAEFLPEMSGQRTLARQLSGCMRILAAQGRLNEVAPLLNAWKPFGRQYFGSGQDTIIQLLVGNVNVKLLAKSAAEVETQLGQAQRGIQTLAELQRFCKPMTDYHNRINQKFDYTTLPSYQHGSLITILLMKDTWNDLTLRDLSPLRNAEQALWMEMALTFITILILFAVLWATYRWLTVLLTTRSGVVSPLLLLPTRNEFIQIVGYGVLLPLIAYAVYYAIPFLSRRNYGMLAPGMSLQQWGEWLVMTVVLLALPAGLATHFIRRRCRALGVPTTNVWQEYRHKLIMGAFFIAAAGCLYGVYFCWMHLVEDWTPVIFFVSLVLLGADIVGIVIYMHRTVSGFLFFDGTIARSLIPVYALVILLISCAHPYLLYQETYWFTQDRIIFNADQSNTNIFGLENRVTTRLQHEMMQAAKEMGF